MGWYALGGIMCVMGVAVLVFMFAIVADSFESALPRFVFVLPLVAIALLIGGSWLLMSQQRSARVTPEFRGSTGRISRRVMAVVEAAARTCQSRSGHS
jgi:membrane glycosyltransferase